MTNANTMDELKKLRVADLKDMLTEKNLPTNGLKAELITRLLDAGIETTAESTPVEQTQDTQSSSVEDKGAIEATIVDDYINLKTPEIVIEIQEPKIEPATASNEVTSVDVKSDTPRTASKHDAKEWKSKKRFADRSKIPKFSSLVQTDEKKAEQVEKMRKRQQRFGNLNENSLLGAIEKK